MLVRLTHKAYMYMYGGTGSVLIYKVHLPLRVGRCDTKRGVHSDIRAYRAIRRSATAPLLDRQNFSSQMVVVTGVAESHGSVSNGQFGQR